MRSMTHEQGGMPVLQAASRACPPGACSMVTWGRRSSGLKSTEDRQLLSARMKDRLMTHAAGLCKWACDTGLNIECLT